MDEASATRFLSSLLNKNLRVVTTDTRMFWGQFKCTDPDRNLILANAYEYRHPTPEQFAEHARKTGATTTTLEMTSRYLGLVVVPGEHIVRIELEEYESQLRAQQRRQQQAGPAAAAFAGLI